MKEAYIDHNFTAKTLDLIETANGIIEEYQAQGFNLTVRQLYYQLVARDIIPNSQKSYKRIISVTSNARLAGHMDWDAIEDRTRKLKRNAHWTDEQSMMSSAARWFEIDKWVNQPARIEVWIEKEALSGVIQPICNRLDIGFFACKGYPSLTMVKKAAERMNRYWLEGQEVHILHLGDHDPSGIDMTRDIEDRIELLMDNGLVRVDRLALNYSQIELYDPPPYFVKMKDSRSGTYVPQYGVDSWELDALSPEVLADLIETAVLEIRDEEIWDKDVADQERMTGNLNEVNQRWREVAEHLNLEGWSKNGQE